MPLDYLPAVATEAFPELASVAGAGEAVADCANCVMVPDRVPANHPRAFNPDTQCCTHYPDLPNFLVGRALSRGDTGAAVVRRQLARVGRVSVWGLEQPEGELNPIGRYFGRDLSSRCPYFVGGEHGCAIWRDRDGVCRTWFCRYGEGAQGRERWQALKDLLEWLETTLANICVETGSAPKGEPSISEWAEWFHWCADHVEHITRAELDANRDEQLTEVLAEWAAQRARPVAPLPDVVVPVVARSTEFGGGFALEGYSGFDWVDVGGDTLELFVAMDGARPWREAVALCHGEAETIAALVRELHRVDILQAPKNGGTVQIGSDALPDFLVPATALPIVHAERVWIQGAPRLGSVLAPRSVFELLSRLDSETPWRQALRSAQQIDPALDERLVAQLYRIGAVADASA